jgi:Cd2+/Zn2+-exporting ATPase
MDNCCDKDNCRNGCGEKPSRLWQNKKFLWLIGSLLVIIPFEIFSFFEIHFSPWLELPVIAAVLVLVGRKVIMEGLESLMKMDFSNINLLMTVAVVGALFLGKFEEAAIIVVLFSLGEALEEYGISRSKDALKDLIDKTPRTAQLKGANNRTPIEEIAAGRIIIAKPGDLLPLDGKIIGGSSLIDESLITGEPMPKNKCVGDAVFAGTMNLQGYLEIEVTKAAKDTTLAKIIELTYQSAEKKSRTQKFIERFVRYYTPLVLFSAVAVVVVPVFLLGQPFDFWFVQALTLLIISCPCALVIAAPVAAFSAIGNATKKGILIKGSKFIEDLSKIKVIAFDKTRTLTKGRPVVTDVVPLNGVTAESLLACAAGLESYSEHPIAKSIMEKASQLGLEITSFKNFQSVYGKGLRGDCSVCVNSPHCAGTLKFISEQIKNSQIGAEALKIVKEIEGQGKTAIIFSDDQRIKGIIGVADEIRPESREVIKKIKEMGIKPIMLTGDNAVAAEFVAKDLGINDFRAELLPEQKEKIVADCINEHKFVAMVGDGVNDAPALSRSTVGIAMGAVGSDLAIENADVALMNSNLRLIPYLVSLARKCTATIKFNVMLAIITKLTFLMLAIGGISSLSMAIFADVGVTLIVVVNGLTLFRFRKKQG